MNDQAKVIFEIEGNTITRKEIFSSRSVELESVLGKLTTYTPTEISPLPHGTRYLSTAQDATGELLVNIIIEENPRVQPIKFKDAMIYDRDEGVRLEIAVPFTQLWVTMKGSKTVTPTGEKFIWAPSHWGMFWSRTPFQNLDTPVTYPHMPNCYRDTRVCFGTNNINANMPIGEYVDSLYNTFWLSEFNMDLRYEWPYETMQDWHDKTVENPANWTTEEWNHVWNHEAPVRQWIAKYDKLNWADPVPDHYEGTPIPTLKTQPTFIDVQRWLDGISTNDQQRLYEALRRTYA